MANTVEMGKSGRIVLPKETREKYGLTEKSRMIIRERGDEIVLIPVKRYQNPTAALYGSIHLDKPVDDPKQAARRHIRERLREET
ncbi:MAG: AbrB/MazE/SpoVT family DNA-binding domain-containing protein [Candidatus Bathyarchaeota archaeon]|nr:AbrB/MazE/SpoVT family DNA-binding domain-containing protein [Candidatus Bathyarchaeota archaeon]